MRLKEWLNAERGRRGQLAHALRVTRSRVSQIAADGVPKTYLLLIRDFTQGEVTLEDMLADQSAFTRNPERSARDGVPDGIASGQPGQAAAAPGSRQADVHAASLPAQQ